MDGLLAKSMTHEHTHTLTEAHTRFLELLTFLKSEPAVRHASIKLEKMAGADEKRPGH